MKLKKNNAKASANNRLKVLRLSGGFTFFNAFGGGSSVRFVYIFDFSVIEGHQIMINQTDKRKKMIAKIHIAKSQLGLDDDVYRELLQNVTGLSSCAKMNILHLENVLIALKMKGFQDDGGGIGRMPLHLVEHRPMMNKIAVLLKQTGKTWAYADGMAKKMFQKERLNLLNTNEMHDLLKALQIYANRHAQKQETKNEIKST